MFGMEYVFALMGIMTQIGFAIVNAIPTWYCWNKVVPLYAADYVPASMQILPYWHVACILFLITIIGEQISKLVPKLVTVKTEK